jgi:POT family proton-dependent oligopeptide transporter
MAENHGFIDFLHTLHLDTPNGWSWAFGVSGFGMLVGLANFVFRHRLVKDVNLATGESEPAPVSLPFVALLVVVLLGLAYMVVGAEKWYVQLGLGAGAATLLMFTVQLLVDKGLVKTRAHIKANAGEGGETPRLSKEDVSRILVVLMMLCFSITFWFVFQQAGSSLNLFAKQYTDRILFGFEVPASWFQTVNAVGIVVLGPVFVWIWTKRGGKWPSSPVKFALGLLMASLGFWILVPACHIAQSVPNAITKVSMGWLFSVYVVHTIGELCISPVGLSYVSRLAPRHMTSQLMGAWFFSIGIGAYLAGRAAGLMDSVPLTHIYGFGAAVSLFMGLLLMFVITPVIRRMMGGYS